VTKAFLDKYGNPDANGDGILDPQWFKENITIFEFPFPLVLSWRPSEQTRRFQAHRLAGARIVSAYSRIGAHKGIPYLREQKLDRWGGCFNFRLVRGGTELSVHAWGAAVDHCPDLGRMGSAEDAATYPRFIVEAFEAEGFVWGGNWKRPDAMHFELQE
jgi:hypothetical protein